MLYEFGCIYRYCVSNQWLFECASRDWLDAHNKSDMADMIRDLMSDDFMSTMQEYAIKYTGMS